MVVGRQLVICLETILDLGLKVPQPGKYPQADGRLPFGTRAKGSSAFYLPFSGHYVSIHDTKIATWLSIRGPSTESCRLYQNLHFLY